MGRNVLEGLRSWVKSLRLRQDKSTSRMSRVAIFTAVCLIWPTLGAAQNAPTDPKCAALTQLNLENAPGGPALITSARLVDVPASGLEQ